LITLFFVASIDLVLTSNPNATSRSVKVDKEISTWAPRCLIPSFINLVTFQEYECEPLQFRLIIAMEERPRIPSFASTYKMCSIQIDVELYLSLAFTLAIVDFNIAVNRIP